MVGSEREIKRISSTGGRLNREWERLKIKGKGVRGDIPGNEMCSLEFMPRNATHWERLKIDVKCMRGYRLDHE